MIVQLHSVVLLNIADTLTRSSGNSVGVLLGYATHDKIVAVTSFELASEDAGYVEARYNLFKDVYPQCSVVGVYQLNGKDESKLGLVQGVDRPVLLTIDESFHPQSYVGGELAKTVIDSSETEVIATSTIANKEFKSKQQVSVKDFDERLDTALTKLSKISETPIPDAELVLLANSLTYKGATDKEKAATGRAAADLASVTAQLLYR